MKAGILSPELWRALHRAFKRRQVHDYGEVVRADLSAANESIADAEQFVAAVGSYLTMQR